MTIRKASCSRTERAKQLSLKYFMYYTARHNVFLSLSLSTQHVSALNGHLQLSYHAKTVTLYYYYPFVTYATARFMIETVIIVV
jgi:hypothetical protein